MELNNDHEPRKVQHFVRVYGAAYKSYVNHILSKVNVLSQTMIVVIDVASKSFMNISTLSNSFDVIESW